MPKKKSLAWRITKGSVALLGKGILGLGKLGISGTKYIYYKYKTKKQEAQEKQKEELRPIKKDYQNLEAIKTSSGDINKFENILNESKVGLVIGAAGSGKSAISLRLMENIHSKFNKKVMAIGFKKEDMPRWVKIITKVDEIENDAFVIIDEGGVLLSSRNSQSAVNKLISELLFIRRHKNIGILFITQNSSNIEINTIRQSSYLIFKKFEMLQKEMERKPIKTIYERIENEFNKLDEKYKNQLSYIYSDQFNGFVLNKLPSYWSEKVSKSFR